MIVCGKVNPYEFNCIQQLINVNSIKYKQISMAQRSSVHSLGLMLYKISLAIPFDGKYCLASEMLLFEAQCVIILFIR